jgi:hypothetical protein
MQLYHLLILIRSIDMQLILINVNLVQQDATIQDMLNVKLNPLLQLLAFKKYHGIAWK